MMEDVDQYGHPRVPHRGYYDKEMCIDRRKWAENFSWTSLEHVGEWWKNEGTSDSLSYKMLKGNIENLIGLAKVPIGIVGPILINGHHIKGYVLCPFATTEGALVASATRGAAALTRSGGIKSHIIEQVMVRAPAFLMNSIDDAELLWSWVVTNFKALKLQTKLYSQYTTLSEIKPHRFGRTIIFAFKYQTTDAAGQNMVTTATWHACKWLLQAVKEELPTLKIRKFFIESNFSGDKKIAFGNLLNTRGVHVIAEAWIPESVIESTFKTTINDFLSIYQVMLHTSKRIGCVGFNVNVANALAAVFTATGQDIACIAESATAHLTIEPWSHDDMSGRTEVGKGVYVSLVLPSLIIGTVGGGTGLPTQKELLNLMNCFGPGKVNRLGEIIVSVALGLEISTLASLANGTFAISHEKLGRNAPDNGLKDTHINNEFFIPVVKANEMIVSWETFNINTRNSIISELSKSDIKKKVGHFGYVLKYLDKQNTNQCLPVVMKSKPTDTETCNVINKMAVSCGFKLGNIHEEHKTKTGFKYCHIREVSLAFLKDSVLRKFSPKVYHTILDTRKDIYVIMMEYLQKDTFTHLSMVDELSEWSVADIKVVLRDLAKLHANFFLKKDWLYSTSWLEENSLEKMKLLQPLWLSLLQHAELEFPQFWTHERVQLLRTAINHIPQLWVTYENAPKTLVHNDCNPRNLCLRKSSLAMPKSNENVPYNDPRTLCLYDWELARIDIPQRDIVEFLAFVLPPTTNGKFRMELVEFYKKHFEYFTGIYYPVSRFFTDYDVACLDFAMNRLLYYTMAHTYKDYSFLPRVVGSHFAYMTESNIFKNVHLNPKL